MKLSRFLALLAVSTVAALLYVGQQVEAVKIGYQINQQQSTLSDVLDQRQMLLYNICNQKSPENLQESFSKKSDKTQDFQIVDNKRIVVLSGAKKNKHTQLAHSWTSFFKIVSLAEAKDLK